MKYYIIFIFLFIFLANSKELVSNKRNNWTSCVNITTPIEATTACVSFEVTSNCGGVKKRFYLNY